jgi:Asp/Glu/hydantoin racemase
MARILVINPNSSTAVTAQIDTAIGTLRRDGGPSIDVLGLADGPPGIQSQVHVESVVQPLLRCVREEPADAYVIACFSDPGLHAAREIARAPVFGIAECAVFSALQRGSRFGVIAILNNSIPRHLRYFGAMGVMSRFAGDRAIGMGVAELADEHKTFERMRKAAIDLRDIDGADVLIMGCAGMAQQRQRLADDVGLPVIEPTQAAVSAAIGALTLGW